MARSPALKNEQTKLRAAQTDFINVLMLRRRYDENTWREAIQKAINSGAVEAVVIECIIRNIPISGTLRGGTIHEKLAHLDVHKWDCELSVYADIRQEVVSC